MNNYLSYKLKAVSFLLMVLVVYLHSTNLEVEMNGDTKFIPVGYNSFIQYFLVEGIARIAVPLFFLISGYLFFLNIKDGHLYLFVNKYQKRLKTLVLPYLLWSIYGITVYLILQSIPQSKPFFKNELVRDYSISYFLFKLFISPIPYQLWFVRDLVIISLFSPFIYWAIKNLKYLVITFFLITWFFKFNFFLFSNEAILFFTIGAFLSINRINPQKFEKKNHYLLFIIGWFIIIFSKTFLTQSGFDNSWVLIILHKTSILFGIVSIWFLYDILFENKDISKRKYFKLFQYTFFLYAFHEPILTILKKSSYFVFGITEFTSFLIFIITPFFTICISLVIGFFLKRIYPKFYYLITGGR